MTVEKIERNQLIAKLYGQGRTNREILSGLQKAGYSDLGSIASVKMQVSKLRKAGKVPKERPLSKIEKEVAQASGGLIKFANKITSQEVDKSRSPQVKESRKRQVDKSRKLQDKGIGKYKPVTFRISEETEWQLKSLAVSRREKVSELVREIFNDYLSRHREVEK